MGSVEKITGKKGNMMEILQQAEQRSDSQREEDRQCDKEIIADTVRREAVEKLKMDAIEKNLWDCIVTFQRYPFYTSTGLPFTYILKVGKKGNFTKELFIDRREHSKSLSWSSVRMAFEKAKERDMVFTRPKEIADIRGISYSYSLLWRFGMIRVPPQIEERLMGKKEENTSIFADR